MKFILRLRKWLSTFKEGLKQLQDILDKDEKSYTYFYCDLMAQCIVWS